jgi:hypothetical protein
MNRYIHTVDTCRTGVIIDSEFHPVENKLPRNDSQQENIYLLTKEFLTFV